MAWSLYASFGSMSRSTATAGNQPSVGRIDGDPAPVAGSLAGSTIDALPFDAASVAGMPAPRSIVLVGLMGAGKTTIGRKLAVRLGLPFRDADIEIEQAAGRTITEMFALWGELEFREGERRVISRLLSQEPVVLATGGGAFMDPRTRAAIREHAVSVWLRCPLPTLVRRVSGRTHRPLLANGNAREILEGLMRVRHPVYAKADIVIDCDDDSTEHTTQAVMAAVNARLASGMMEPRGLAPQPVASTAFAEPPTRVHVALQHTAYDILIGAGLIERAGQFLAPLLPQMRAMIVTDEHVAALHLPALRHSLEEAGIRTATVVVPAGESSKSLHEFGRVTSTLLEAAIERRTTIIALGGGVVGDLAGYAAAAVMRGLPFVQIPTTLLSQVDSSVGGKTGINTAYGKNLIGAFHQPLAVLADTASLATLSLRELRAGYAEILKAGLIGDAALFDWCLVHGAAVVSRDAARQAEAIAWACRFKASVVGDDEREEKPNDGRALLNLGHSFGHALEAELHYDGRLLHGEAVAIGLGLALKLSARLGYCHAEISEIVINHLESIGLPARIRTLSEATGVTFSVNALLAHMQRDKKMRDGKLAFVLLHGIGQAFTSRSVAAESVSSLLFEEGCIT